MTDAKESGTLKSRIKNLLTSHKHQSTTDGAHPPHSIPDANVDFWAIIAPSNNAEERIAKLRDFEKALTNKQIDCDVIERIWLETKDLLDPNSPVHARAAYFLFLKTLIKSQSRHIRMMRALLNTEVMKHVYLLKSDLENVMEIMYVLTEHGKNLYILEQEIGILLVQWMESLHSNSLYIDMLCNVIKFNSSHLTEETIHGIVKSVCSSCNNQYETCLKVLEALVTFKALPKHCANDVINTLCHSLNNKDCCDQSWNLMRNLLGTHLGHSCIQTMLEILQSDITLETCPQARSAISYIGMGLWGSKCVKSLMYTPQSILPSFEYALKSQSVMLAFEVVLTCQRLVKKFGHELHISAWDNIVNIIEELLAIVANTKNTSRVAALKENTHELVSIVENLCQIQAFGGSKERLNNIIEKHILDRPTASIINLLTERLHTLSLSKENWIFRFKEIIFKFYSPGIKTAIRLKVLELEMVLVAKNFTQHECDIVDAVILPQFAKLPEESNLEVLEKSSQFLTDVCLLCTSNRFFAVLNLFKPLLTITTGDSKLPKNSVLIAVATTVCGLKKIFLEKFHTPFASHSVAACQMFVELLEKYYEISGFSDEPYVLWESRMDIFDSFFKIRTNSLFQARLSHVRCFSPNIICHISEQGSVQNNTEPVYLPFQRIIQACIRSLEHENYWPILQTVLDNICVLLENKHITVCLSLEDIDTLIEVLSNFVSSTNRIATLKSKPEGFKRADLQLISLNVLTQLTTFYNKIDTSRQRQILRCLYSGLTTKCAKHCLSAITLCMIEMRADATIRVLPSILLHLSHMSATVHLATAVLELLSTLSQLPHLYSDFVEDQYLTVFAITLQHANPVKFSLYVVSLAHNIVSMWFVKCRPSFRSGFVQFITRHLQTANRDHTENSLQHSLIESSIDVMARYAFSNSMPVMEHSALRKTKLANSQSATWLLGNRLVTITTGIPQRYASTENGVADIFPLPNLGRKMSVEAPGKLQSTESDDVHPSRNRHKSSGANLRSTRNHLAPMFRSDSGSTTICKKHSVEKSTTWAEICVRRPSGNTCWMIQTNQFQLVAQTKDVGSNTTPFLKPLHGSLTETSNGLEEHPSEDTMSKSTGFLEFRNQPRQRSRTLGSSNSNTALRAVERAKIAKQKQQRASTDVLKHDAHKAPCPNNENNITPAFVFLQLFHSAAVADPMQLPFLLPKTATIDRAVQVLDHITPYDIWSTGVVYVGPDQGNDGKAILSNEHGSSRYQALLNTLGKLVLLEDCNKAHVFLGGLDQTGEDGQFTYVWQENIMQMVFHVTTLMPNSGYDSCKTRHIGNDYVLIVYDDDKSQDYVPGCVVKGQFLSIEIIIKPIELNFNVIELHYHKPELEGILQITGKRIVSDKGLGLLVRQTALHANMAALAFRHKHTPDDCVSKPLSRLKQIKRIRSRAIQESISDSPQTNSRNSCSKNYSLEEFSDYV